MIDIENEVYDLLCDHMESKFPGINMTGDSVAAPSEFPCVALEEADNYSDVRTQDTGSNENHAIVLYELTIYSNKVAGRKAEAKAIASEAGDFLQKLGFTRKSMNPAPSGGDKVYRLVCRFTAEVSANHQIFRR